MKRSFSTLLLIFALALPGCRIAIFDKPVTVSSRTAWLAKAERLERVTVERCNYVILLFVPIIRDPEAAYEELLDQAQEKGGNAVVDFQVRDSGFVTTFGLFTRGCWEATGIAAKI